MVAGGPAKEAVVINQVEKGVALARVLIVEERCGQLLDILKAKPRGFSGGLDGW